MVLACMFACPSLRGEGKGAGVGSLRALAAAHHQLPQAFGTVGGSKGP
jgi:hypothetical protein